MVFNSIRLSLTNHFEIEPQSRTLTCKDKTCTATYLFYENPEHKDCQEIGVALFKYSGGLDSYKVQVYTVSDGVTESYPIKDMCVINLVTSCKTILRLMRDDQFFASLK